MAQLLKIKQKAPTFATKDVFGKKVSFKDYKDGYLLLAFLRYSGCPWCNLAIHRLSLEYEQLKERGCDVLAFIQSDNDSVKDNIYGRHVPKPPFPIVADPQMKFYKLYGVNPSVLGTAQSITKIPYWLKSVYKLGFKQKRLDGKFFLVPAWFLINLRSGEIVKAEKGISFYDHETFVRLYNSLIFKD